MAILKFPKWPPAAILDLIQPRSAIPENPTIEPNMKGIGWLVAELRPFEIFQSVWMGPEVGRSVIIIIIILWNRTLGTAI